MSRDISDMIAEYLSSREIELPVILGSAVDMPVDEFFLDFYDAAEACAVAE